MREQFPAWAPTANLLLRRTSMTGSAATFSPSGASTPEASGGEDGAYDDVEMPLVDGDELKRKLNPGRSVIEDLADGTLGQLGSPATMLLQTAGLSTDDAIGRCVVELSTLAGLPPSCHAVSKIEKSLASSLSS